MCMSMRTHAQTNIWQDGLKLSDCNSTETRIRDLADSIGEILAYCLTACAHDMCQDHAPMNVRPGGPGPGAGGRLQRR